MDAAPDQKASATPAKPDAPPLGLGMQVAYGFGSTAFGIAWVPLSQGVLMLYFNQVIQIEAVLVGIAIWVSVMVDAFTDPLIGWISDRLRTPLGRRHVLMYAAAIPASFGFFIMWQAPDGLSPELMLAFTIAILIFVNISISLYEVPNLALAPELAPDYSLRTRLIGFRWFFLIIGSAAANFILYQVYLREDENNPLGVLNRDRYEEFGVACAIVIFVAILVSTAATHSRIKYLHTPRPRPVSLRSEWSQIKAALTHKPLVMLALGGLMMGFAAGITFTLINYLYLHFWRLLPQEIGYFVVPIVIASFLALWLGPTVSSIFGKKRAIIGLYAVWLVNAVTPISLRFLGVMPENGSPYLLPILLFSIGLSYTLAVSCHIILGSSIADTVDDISVKTGIRSEGMMFSTYQVLDKVSNGGGGFVAGVVLSALAFPMAAVAGTVDQGIINNLALTQLCIVVIFNVASILFFTQYSLTRDDHERNAAVLAERKARERAEAEEIAASAVVNVGGGAK
jgi:GPH family glycoside/pentoside/hexuronide:cation symporter